MQQANRYYNGSKRSEVEFRYLLRLFALNLTASDAARLTGLSVRAPSAVYRHLRRRLQTWCQTWCTVPAELDGAVELDESYFGPRRVRGKRGRGTGGKTIVFGLFKRGGQGTRKLCPTALKKSCRPSYAAKLTRPRWSTPTAGADTTGWWMSASTPTSASATARTSSCKGPRASMTLSPFGALPKPASSSLRACPNTLFAAPERVRIPV